VSFDWYAFHGKNSINEIKAESFDCFSKIKLLGIHGSSDDTKKLHKELVYGLRNPKKNEIAILPKYPKLITDTLSILYKLDLKIPKIIDLNPYPEYSFFLQFTFTLATPYISRDDEEFYICDNPIRKDKVFKVPMVAGSSWKGNMRWTAMKIFTDGLPEGIDQNSIREQFESRARIVRLFGHEKAAIADYLDSVLAEAMSGDDKSHEKFIENKEFVKEKFRKFLIEKGYINTNVEGRRGRLSFYPTFFNQISLEVINPHDRTTKAGTQPIYIESVPEGAGGTFSLLYSPFDLMGKREVDVKNEVIKDLEAVYHATRKMMLMYGFSAKKSSGFGIVRKDIDGVFGGDSFSSFKKLKQLIDKFKKEVMKND